MRIRDIGIIVGELPPGKLNKISDVPGVRVGHSTIATETHNTGVTVVMPCADNPFARKLPCASFVLNGFGKTAGLVQIDELGTLETPIALTNTLNVGLAHDALVEFMIKLCAADRIELRSINPVVCECNDSSLNNIRERAVKAEHVFSAIASASADFAEGAVGCGRGTICHGMKGGVGSASRVMNIAGREYVLGALIQTNHGRAADFMIGGKKLFSKTDDAQSDKGSCIVIVATDLPLSDRQLKRVIKRCSVGLARLGSFIGNGSGEVFIGFSTANRASIFDADIRDIEAFREDKIDIAFRAAAECTEEAALNSLIAAEPVGGRRTLSEFITPRAPMTEKYPV